MKGKHKVVVFTKRLKYEFELRRNLTIIRGDSATGKTTLVDMVRDFVNNQSNTPVELVCDKKCYVLEGVLWKELLAAISDSIVFIDEGNEFIKTKEFAKEIQNTDNYYVIVTREALPSLPYSVEEIYGIRTSGKYGTLKQSYHEFYRLYGEDVYVNEVNPEIIITEDSNSGYQFFKKVCKENGLNCESMNGKSNIFQYLNKHKNERMLVIADGAAFGSEMDRMVKLLKRRKNIVLYLPESFEWLILKSDVLDDREVRLILQAPVQYIDSKHFLSWERYFTALLIEKTKGSYLQYTKKKLNPVYLQANEQKKICGQMKQIEL